MITYYFYMQEGKPVAVHRWRETEDKLYLERWDGKGWVESHTVHAATGLGGDNPFEEISAKEALAFIKSH